MANNIVSQVSVEVLIKPNPKAVISQLVCEVLVNPNASIFKPKIIVI